MPPRSDPSNSIPNPRAPTNNKGLDEKRARNRAYQRKFHKRHPNYWESYKRNRESPEKQRDRHLKKTYGLTLDIVRLLEKEQNGKCAICLKDTKLYVDHDHKTNKIRSLLCSTCNTGLGFFQENIATLQAAIAYLETWKLNHVL